MKTKHKKKYTYPQKVKTVKLPKIDENAVKNIEQLEDQNIEVQSLFNEARNNPFSE